MDFKNRTLDYKIIFLYNLKKNNKLRSVKQIKGKKKKKQHLHLAFTHKMAFVNPNTRMNFASQTYT